MSIGTNFKRNPGPKATRLIRPRGGHQRTHQTAIVCSLVALLSVLSSSTLCFAHNSQDNSVRRCEPGQVSHRREKMNGVNYHISSTVVNANPESVWKVLTDYKNAPVNMPNIQRLKILKSENGKKQVWFSIRSQTGFKQFEYVLSVRESHPHRIEWQRDSGDFKRYDGFWELQPIDNGKQTLLTYGKHVVGGFLLPQVLVDMELRKAMPAIVLSVQKAAENKQLAEL